MARGQLRLRAQDESEASSEVAEAMAALGLYCEEELVIDEDEFWLWPENEEAFWTWCAVQTQWVTGMAGAVGLNYAGVESCLRMRGLGKGRRRQLFAMVQVMEQSALEEWASKR
jgi:hypothetical protein